MNENAKADEDTPLGDAAAGEATQGEVTTARDVSPKGAPSPALGPLQEAAAGLLFPSETDAPLVPFFWPAEPADTLTPARVAELAGAAADAPVQSVKLETFFRPVTKEEDWHNDEEQAQVQRFRELVKTIKATLREVQVFRVGNTKIDVYIVGQVEGGYAGLKTQVVET